MPPATNTESPDPTTVSSPGKPPPQRVTLPPASIAVLVICLVLVGIMMFYVIYRHFSVKSNRKARKAKKRHEPTHAHNNAQRDQAALLVTTPEKKVPAASTLHSTCTLVATASSKIFCPPVMLQFRIPGTKKTITLYGAGSPSPVRNGDKGTLADPRPDVESTKENSVTPFIIPQSPKWPPPIMGRSAPFTPLNRASKGSPDSLKDGIFGANIQDSSDGNVRPLVSNSDNVRNIRKPLASKDITTDMMWSSKVTAAQQPVSILGIIRSVSQRMPPRMSVPHIDMPKLPPKALGQENVDPTLRGPLSK